MLKIRVGHTGRAWRRAGFVLAQGVVLALAVSVAVPARAGGERAVKSRVAPVYPELARRMRITGSVRVEATVNSEGKVLSVRTVSGNYALSPAAEEAVSKWRFAPGTETSTVDIDINFNLAQ